MDTFRQAGESLAGRYFHYRLWPLSVAELRNSFKPQEAFRLLQKYGGFPEPFLSGDETQANRWRAQYFVDLVREDILEFGRLQEIRVMRVLLELLRKRVGSPLSYASIARDLKVAPNTVRRYVELLEALHIVFLARPHHANIARAIQKMPKLYFYDIGIICSLLGIQNTELLQLHPFKGHIFEYIAYGRPACKILCSQNSKQLSCCSLRYLLFTVAHR